MLFPDTVCVEEPLLMDIFFLGKTFGWKLLCPNEGQKLLSFVCLACVAIFSGVGAILKI